MSILTLLLIPPIILLWPRWLRWARGIVVDRAYFRFSPRLSYSQTQTIVRSLLYFVYGITAAGVMLVFDGNSFLIQAPGVFLPAGTGWVWLAKLLADFILLFFASSAVIFSLGSILLPGIVKRTIQPSDFRGTWLEMYMEVRPRILMLGTAFLPIVVEELVFRVLVTSALLNTLGFFNGTLGVMVSALGSGVVFLVGQSVMLDTRVQRLVVGCSALCIGTINSAALLLGSSFYSVLLAHYAFVSFVVLNGRKDAGPLGQDVT